MSITFHLCLDFFLSFFLSFHSSIYSYCHCCRHFKGSHKKKKYRRCHCWFFFLLFFFISISSRTRDCSIKKIFMGGDSRFSYWCSSLAFYEAQWVSLDWLFYTTDDVTQRNVRHDGLYGGNALSVPFFLSFCRYTQRQTHTLAHHKSMPFVIKTSLWLLWTQSFLSLLWEYVLFRWSN